MFRALLLIALSGGCSGDPAVDASSDSPPVEETLVPEVLASGTFGVSYALDYEEDGFHHAFEHVETLPENLGPTAGWTLQVSMWDAGRPDQECMEHHPLFGCVTVDWSDAIGRPHVPPDGVFNNVVKIVDDAGAQTWHLTETRGLADTPDDYSPA